MEQLAQKLIERLCEIDRGVLEKGYGIEKWKKPLWGLEADWKRPGCLAKGG